MTCSDASAGKDRSFSEKRQVTPVIQHVAIIAKEEMKRNMLSIQTFDIMTRKKPNIKTQLTLDLI